MSTLIMIIKYFKLLIQIEFNRRALFMRRRLEKAAKNFWKTRWENETNFLKKKPEVKKPTWLE